MFTSSYRRPYHLFIHGLLSVDNDTDIGQTRYGHRRDTNNNLRKCDNLV